MPRLSWINDDDLFTAINNLLQKAEGAKRNTSKNFGKNVIDPFSAIFEMSGFEMRYDEWVKSEEARQSQKTLQNFVGDFHQIILGFCSGWQNLKTGKIIDLVNVERKIIAEVKNKFNTVSYGKLADLYKSLESVVMPKTSIYKDYTAYYVAVIPPSPTRFNKTFTPSNKDTGSRCPSNPLIREIDGASFYALVTGDQNALEDLFEVIPQVISEIKGENHLDIKRLKVLFDMAYKGTNAK